MAGKERMTRIAKGAAGQVDALLADIRGFILAARRAVVRSVDILQVVTSFEIGRRIVEHAQHGTNRAAYGKVVVEELAKRLTAEFGKGFSKSNLEYMRRFYTMYRDRYPSIAQTPSGQLTSQGKSQTASGASSAVSPLARRATSPKPPFALGWSHYVLLMGIGDPEERAFYEIEAVENGWSIRELKRQFNASLYERLALSRDKRGIRKLAQHGQIVSRPHDLLKEPYVLEFLGLDEKAAYSETDLESAIIDKLEHFLLELGKGFLFEARQKRFTLLRPDRSEDRQSDPPRPRTDADVRQLLRPAGEEGRRTADHRHHPLQEEARRVGHNHPAQKCEYPRQGIPAVLAVERRIAAQARRMGGGTRGETVRSTVSL